MAPKSNELDRGGRLQQSQLHALLPQTQCRRCTYVDCLGYAQALAQGQAQINQCQPGGAQGIERLARALACERLPLDPEFGFEAERSVVWIDESACIGCTRCLEACPVDAIVGASKHMHTVIESECTGCELCIAACPVDCIELEIATPGLTGWQAWSPEQAARALARYEAHKVQYPQA